MVGSDAAFIIAKDHVHDPVQAVLDRPVTADDRSQKAAQQDQGVMWKRARQAALVEMPSRRPSSIMASMPSMRNVMLNPGTYWSKLLRRLGAPLTLVSKTSSSRGSRTSGSGGNAVVSFSSEGFAADLLVDDQGYVIDYPGLAHRI